MAARELIVNADEFGLTEGVNHGIARVHRQGIVTSTTMVANEHAFEHAVALLPEVPELAIGVHLNITHGAPVLPEVRVFSLVDEDGLFYRRNRFLKRMVAGRIDLVQVEDGRLRDLLAAEHQQLAGEIGGPVSGHRNLAHGIFGFGI